MKSIMIIGAGFSGALIATRLLMLNRVDPLCIYLVNGSGRVARGMAYGTQSLHHVLNVPAGNMSALDEDPQHFLRYAKKIYPTVEAGSFVSRRIYGDYLESMLSDAERLALPHIKFKRICQKVTSIITDEKGICSVDFDSGDSLKVNKVVLALGHFPSHSFPLRNSEFYQSDRYLHDPWDQVRLDAIPVRAPVLLVGTGLTAIDVAMSLLTRNPNRSIIAVSRRGLVPQAHRVTAGVPVCSTAESIWGDSNTVRSQLRGFRQFCDTLSQQKRDWREGLAILRPVTAKIWLAYPDKERRRFLRHLQPFWDTHRHRLAPSIAERFNAALASGAMSTLAGRLESIKENKEGVTATIRSRGCNQTHVIQTQFVVNCTGPCPNPSQVDNVLVNQLLKDGLLRTDKLSLGLDVTQNCATISETGKISRNLYYIGPWLKATYWEATAVPDLRVMAIRLINNLLIFD
jgi:uncharacterized NAD(P)/FAD-binding protein YdhS